MPPTVALLLKAPRPSQVKTRLAAKVGAVKAAGIYRQLVERQLHALHPDWPATVHYDPPDAGEQMAQWLGRLRPGLHFTPQCHGDLGARLTMAFATEFARGAPAVVAIGGDCPGLDRAILESAQSALATSDAVLGPAADGGYYLIGLNALCADLFAGIDWSTSSVLAQTKARLMKNNLRFAELPTLADVDDADGWERAMVEDKLPEWTSGRL